jgi:YD repeat-containing protein
MTLPGSRTVTYAYDGAGRLASLTDWGNRTTGFAYDADGRRTTVTRPNGVVTTSTYDAAGRLTAIAHATAATTLKSFGYTYDAAGNRVSATSGAGTETYTVDALGRLTAVAYPGGTSESYTYDANGNRLTKTVGGTTTNYTYDDADQLLTEGSITYTHDAAGNVTARGTDSFTWDWRNRLTGAAVGGTTIGYAYDGDDVRVRKTIGQTTATYLWDRASGLPLLVDDGANGYLHAEGPLASVAGSTPTQLLTDALGSVRGTADASGMLAGSADYEAFGAVRGTSTTGSALGFAGELTDADTGLLHLRARGLSPATGSTRRCRGLRDRMAAVTRPAAEDRLWTHSTSS